MRLNFRKISALATSTLLVGMTMGVAAAANYPMPFVAGGAANVAIVYGTGQGVSFLDGLEAGNIQTDLQRYLSGGTGGTTATTSGEVVSLDTSQDRIWINTSLNAVKSTITKNDLKTILADYAFSGNVNSKVTSTIKLITGGPDGDNSGRVIFEKQPTSSDDPAIGISLNSSTTGTGGLYNASATMAAINFTSPDSQGEEIQLFGQKFTISADTTISDTTKIVLLKEAQTITLDSNNPSSTVTIGGATYTVELISASDTSANVKITNSAGVSENKEIKEADSKNVNGISVAVKTADETNLKLSATIIVGADKITLTQGGVVTIGEDNDPIQGTYAYITGGAAAATEIAIAVSRPDSSNDAILEGKSFVDPVFGTFKLDFAGLSSPFNDPNRGMVSVKNSGDNTVSVEFKDDAGNMKSVDFAHNESGSWSLGDNSNYSISTLEGTNLSYNAAKSKYAVVGNEDYGHLIELYDVYNQTTGSNAITNDRVKFRDVMTGETYETTFTSTEGSGTVDIDGKRYTVTFGNSGETAGVIIKYPVSDSGAGEYVIYPTIKMNSGSLLGLYAPQSFSLTGFGLAGATTVSKLWFPDGDGYTGVTAVYNGASADGNSVNWTIGGAGGYLNTSAAALANYTNVTIGKLTYSFTSTGTANRTKVYLLNPEDGLTRLAEPGLTIFEGKDDDTNYHAVVVDLEPRPAGTSTDGVGVNDILFSSTKYHNDATKASDSDFTDDVDWYGTFTEKDSSDSDQKTATISIPTSQVYAQLYVGEINSAVTPGTTGTTGSTTSIGGVLVKDSEVSSVSTKNLIVVGGSCINSAAATLVGGAYCGDAWTTATKVGAGEFLIKGYASSTLTSKLALLVAGYNAPDTVNAATYLRTQTVDTAMNYKGTSSTSATVVTTTA
ncbi:hypothetical protein HY212_01990 [Candidatus Pacearchaeota archaeon]|nr:hypothetical protein [Candidatus Pacearchaeota archaeon]